MTRISKLLIYAAVFAAAPLVMAQPDQVLVSDGIGQAKSALANGKLSQALSLYESLARQTPESSAIMEGLGSAQLLNRHYIDAVTSYQKAVSLGETSGRSFVGMGMAYIHLGMFNKAEAALKEARNRQASPNRNLEQVLGWLEQRQGPEPDGTTID